MGEEYNIQLQGITTYKYKQPLHEEQTHSRITFGSKFLFLWICTK